LGREGTFRWQVLRAGARAWVGEHRPVMLIIALVMILVVAVVWQPATGWIESAVATPTPKPLTLCNGGFEDKFACWQRGGALEPTVKCDEKDCYAVLGNPDYPCDDVPVGEAWITQTVKVPQISPTLSLRYRVFSYDLDTYDPGLQGDYFQVAINGDPVSERYGNTDWNEASCDGEPWDSDWQTVPPLDLSDYRGQEVEILLHIVSTDPYYNTWTYVDDVRIDGTN